MDYNKFCSEILKLDSKIRYAGVYDIRSGLVYEKLQKGVKRKLDKEKTRNSLIQAYMRWKTRQQFSPDIGEPVYAMAKYVKINRITMPCGKNALLVVNTEMNLEPHEIINDILNLIEKFSDDPDYAPRNPSFSF